MHREVVYPCRAIWTAFAVHPPNDTLAGVVATPGNKPELRTRSIWSRVSEFLLIAVGYGLACTVFERLALPLVFTSVLWLPAGLAFGIVYVRGYRSAPALFVGGILGLLTRVTDLHGHLAPGVTLAETTFGVVVEAIIVVGHSVLGVWLVHRFVRDRSLATLRSASLFLLLVGPVACLVGAVLGPPAMLARSVVDHDGIWSVSFGWWTGDGMGVLLLAPLAAVLAGPAPAWRSRSRPILAVVAVTTAAVFAMHTLIMHIESTRIRNQFQATTEQVARQADAAIAGSEQQQDDLGDRLSVTSHMSQREFDAGAQRIADAVPGTRSVAWLHPAADGEWLLGQQFRVAGAVFAPIDVDALRHARDDGHAIATPRVRPGAEDDVALYRPVYALGSVPSSLADRRAELVGVLRVIVRPRILLDSVSKGRLFRDAGVALGSLTLPGHTPETWHAENADAKRFLVDGQPRPELVPRPQRAATVRRDEITFADHQLPIAVAPAVSYLRSQALLLAAMPLSLASMLLAFTAGAFAIALTGRAALLEQLVASRTEQLARNERRYRSVVDSVAEVIFRIDLEGRLLFVNHAWFDLLGSSDHVSPEGTLLEAHVAASDRARLRDCIERALAVRGEVAEVEVRRTEEDPPRWLEFRMRRDEVDEHVVGTIVDSTARHELETAREQFVSMVSHEFRTPVTVISGAVSTIEQREQDQLPPISQKLLPAMRAASQRLLRLVEDLLLAAQVDSGTLRFEQRRFDLRDVARACATSGAADAEQHGLKLQVDITSEPLPVSGDADRIGQLIDNLLSNAYKYTEPPGTIKVVVARHGDRARVDVIDTGLGIAEDEQELLFDRFWRSRTGARQASGTGLGLAISRQIADAHDGSLTVDSALGLGSTFRLELPLVGEASSGE
jgi:PAS domain S-box-containing protein